MPDGMQCNSCKHFQGIFDGLGRCKAFPMLEDKSIPDEILSGEKDHLSNIEGDGGIKYEQNKAINFNPRDM